MVLMPESFEIDRASSSSAAALDQQHCWNDETHFSGFMHPLSGIPFTSSVNHEQRNVSAWGLGEASSSSGPYRSSNSEWKVENEWPSTVGRHSLRIEDRFGMSSGGMLSLDNSSIGPMFIQGSGSSSTPPSVNSNGVYVGPNQENPSLMECSNLYKSSGSVNNQRPIHPGNEVHPFIPSGSTGFVVEESDVRLGGSLDSRRVPCKRKSFEGHAGQSFIENPNCPQPMESSPWQGTPPCFSMSSGPSTQPLQEQFGPGLCLDLAGGAVPQGLPNMEGSGVSHRNFRLRVNSLDQNDPRPISLSSAIVGAAGNPVATSAPQTSSRLLAANRSLELPPPTAMSGPASDGLQPSLQVPVVAPGGHFIRWNRGLVPRNNTSTSSPILSDEASSGSHSRNMLHQPMFVSNLSSSSTRGLMRAPPGSSSSVAPPGSSNSAAPLGSSSSAAPQLPHHGSSRQPNHPHSRYPRRLSEYVRRQLLSSIGSDLVGGQSNHTSNSSGHPMLSQDVLLSSVPGSSGHRQSLSRPALRMERQGDSVIGIPYPVRTLTASSERRRRFASEVRCPLHSHISHLLLDALKVLKCVCILSSD